MYGVLTKAKVLVGRVFFMADWNPRGVRISQIILAVISKAYMYTRSYNDPLCNFTANMNTGINNKYL